LQLALVGVQLSGPAGRDEEQREVLLQMVRQARSKGWWSDYADVLDESGQTLLSLEDEASSILVHETSFVTPLLQTRSYAWELLASRTDAGLGLVERMVDLRMTRQHRRLRSSQVRPGTHQQMESTYPALSVEARACPASQRDPLSGNRGAP
jgi:hypothetical protein